MDVLIAGGTGFVGSSLCRVLHDRGHAVTAASRSPASEGLPAGVETVSLDVTSPDLAGVVDGYDAVVNLVALPSHTRPRGQSHDSVHRAGTRHLVRASERTGVERFVQMSALGVESDVSTAYLRAKRRAERVVRQSTLDWVIYRPSVVFGDGCGIVPFLERIVPPYVAFLPGGGRMRIQPIWVEDLAPLLAAGVEDARHVGQVYEIGGPEKLTLAEMVTVLRNVRLVVPIPMVLTAVAFAIAGVLPGAPVDLDQYRVLRLDNTTDANDIVAFGVTVTDLQSFGAYLGGKQ